MEKVLYSRIRLFSDFYVLILENNRTQMLEYQENSLSLR